MSAREPRSPLVHCLSVGRFGTAGGTPLQIRERELAIARVIAGRDARDATRLIEQRCGLRFPPPGRVEAGNGKTVIWIAPQTWLVTQRRSDANDRIGQLASVAGSAGVSVVDQTFGYAALRIAGERTRDVLAKGCRIDLHPRAFKTGHAATTLIAHVHCVVWQCDDTPTFELLIPSTLAQHVFEWLCIGASEFGYEVGR